MPIWVVALFGAFYAIGLVMLGVSLWAARRSTAAGRWPTVAGSVTRCELTTTPGRGEAGPSYRIAVEYAYAVNGRRYTGDRLAFGYTADGSTVATQAAIRDRLHGAASVTVRYDPADPATATLSYGLHRSLRFLLAFSLTWMAFVVGATVLLALADRPDDVLLHNLVTR